MTPRVDFSQFLNEPAVVLAVSGGSDSVTLMVLAHEAREASSLSCRLIAATVDHGLRPEAADEARAVGALAEKLGIEHRILVWEGDKPTRGIQAAAREARLSLLAQTARDAGARVALTGHTADDQAETVLMRAERGEGIGLAGMARATLFEGDVWFARPLLDQRRADLRAALEERGLGWSDDPSNRNTEFERVRVRNRLVEVGDALFTDALATAVRATIEREKLARNVAELIDRHARLESGPAIELEARLLSAVETDALHVLRLLIATAGGTSHLPDAERSAAVMRDLREGKGGSLGNARFTVTDRGFLIKRDHRGHAGPAGQFRSPFAAILPAFDLTAAGAVARLLGNPVPAATPWT